SWRRGRRLGHAPCPPPPPRRCAPCAGPCPRRGSGRMQWRPGGRCGARQAVAWPPARLGARRAHAKGWRAAPSGGGRLCRPSKKFVEEVTAQVTACTRSCDYDEGWRLFEASSDDDPSLCNAALHLCAKAAG
ncbi:unnamed protein product, partial [Prorocentrum cordatum]